MFAPALALLIAAAPGPSGPVQTYLDSVRTLYEDLDYEAGLNQLDRARRVSASPQDDVAIDLWRGLILASSGKADEAASAFKQALSINLAAQLPTRASPKVVAQFEDLRAELAQLRRTAASRGPAAGPPTAAVASTPAAGPSSAVSPSPAAPPPASAAGPSPALAPAEVVAPPDGPSRPLWVWAPAIAGGACLVGAAAFAVKAGSDWSQLHGTSPLQNPSAVARDGGQSEVLTLVLSGAAVAGLVTSAALWKWHTPEASVALSAAPNAIAISGVFR